MGDIVCDAKLVAVEAVFMTGALIFVEKRAQIAVRHELKHQTEVGERVPGDTNQLDDVWVLECRHELCFRQKSLDLAHVLPRTRQQHLDRDGLLVVSAGVYFSEATTRKQAVEGHFFARDSHSDNLLVVP
jgi:hypothetical protein